MIPESFSIKPQMSFSMVLFPEPLKPTIANISPDSTLNEISLITVLLSNFLLNF